MVTSLEAGVKYLIIGALSTAFTVFGIALVYGISHTLNFGQLYRRGGAVRRQPDLPVWPRPRAGGAWASRSPPFPFQIWAPDVYQGAPTPVTAFLAIGSKAAGFALLLRVLFIAVPDITAHWSNLLIILSAASILYGNLCAIPQRNLKRLFGYSEHRARRVYAPGHRRPERGWAVRRALLPQRLPLHRARRFHRDLPRAAAGGWRRPQRARRAAPALALAGGGADAGHGLAGRHPAAGGVLWEVPAAQGRHRSKPPCIRAIIAWPLPRWPAW